MAIEMDQIISVVGFTVFIVALILLGILVLLKIEKNRKRELSRNFREFIKEQDLTYKDLRAVPRILIPESLDVVLTFGDHKYMGKKAFVIDISLGGFAARLNFPIRKLPLNTHLHRVRVDTPLNSFVVKTLKSVRMEPQIERRMMAFQIIDIDEDQFEALKVFMAYLHRFLKNED